MSLFSQRTVVNCGFQTFQVGAFSSRKSPPSTASTGPQCEPWTPTENARAWQLFSSASLLNSWGMRAAYGTINKVLVAWFEQKIWDLKEASKELHWRHWRSGVFLFLEAFHGHAQLLDSWVWIKTGYPKIPPVSHSRRPKWFEICGHFQVLNLDQSPTHSQWEPKNHWTEHLLLPYLTLFKHCNWLIYVLTRWCLTKCHHCWRNLYYVTLLTIHELSLTDGYTQDSYF